ncbi:pyridoxal kinase PdxY [Moritella viscosa]|uniref:pyridoxal kinase PdxY n=1 Tax=Moritella viscosa TaxID=80854 RepID=UPI000919A897|nr:pyridoxal kinase PdxY [Moritella viscosa]SGY97932.1 Pyridoxamine kinase [Moritella viscosa]SGY98339.1 Pyridoxamine kinase [Moritella viscosa]
MKSILSIQSHVVFGCAGNSAVAFPIRRMGVEVWPINTVQFSNHTQYQQGWQGMVMPVDQIKSLVDGLVNIDSLSSCDAVLSGYLGSATQGKEVLYVVDKAKQYNVDALYFCDPVMGHPEKGCIVVPEVMDFFKYHVLPKADVIAPNLLELETLTDMRIGNIEQVKQACSMLLDQGVKIVLVKHLSKAGITASQFEMLLATADGYFHITRPLYDFIRQPVGVGDLISGVMLANLLSGHKPVTAFELTNSVVDAVLEATFKQGSYELQLITAQDLIAQPDVNVYATRL